jgi:hypothetical protein
MALRYKKYATFYDSALKKFKKGSVMSDNSKAKANKTQDTEKVVLFRLDLNNVCVKSKRTNNISKNGESGESGESKEKEFQKEEKKTYTNYQLYNIEAIYEEVEISKIKDYQELEKEDIEFVYNPNDQRFSLGIKIEKNDKGKKIEKSFVIVKDFGENFEAKIDQKYINDKKILLIQNSPANIYFLKEKSFYRPVSNQITNQINNLKKEFNNILYLQHIIYGPAGVGKSYSIKGMAKDYLFIKEEDFDNQSIHTVFHPEYSYYDFFGKVMPKTTDGDNVIYEFYPGPFMQALLKAYNNILKKEKNPEKVVLVIDELNRGNAASIFGSLFNLLDRNENGVSEYPLNIFGMERDWLVNKLNNAEKELNKYYKKKSGKTNFNVFEADSTKLFLPHNLSIICTMNTSDETIFSLDKAFERRWKKSFVTAKDSIKNYNEQNLTLENGQTKWIDFLTNLNNFIIKVADVDDVDNATIGAYFIKPVENEIKDEDIKYTLMYYLWYDLFKGYRREVMLKKLGGILENKDYKNIKTFEEFCSVENYQNFINAFKSQKPTSLQNGGQTSSNDEKEQEVEQEEA